MLVNVNTDTRNHLEKDINWKQVPMTKAIKMWTSNSRHIKCEVKNKSYFFYHGNNYNLDLSKEQVRDGIWYIEDK